MPISDQRREIREFVALKRALYTNLFAKLKYRREFVMEPFHALHPGWPVATTGNMPMTDSEWLHYRDLKSRCPACKRLAHIAKRDGTFYFVDDEYNPFVRHAPVKTTEAVFRFFVESYRRNHGTEPEVTGNRVVSKQDLLSGMHMVSAERNSTTGRKVEKDE